MNIQISLFWPTLTYIYKKPHNFQQGTHCYSQVKIGPFLNMSQTHYWCYTYYVGNYSERLTHISYMNCNFPGIIL
jgi:hypothetical protein